MSTESVTTQFPVIGGTCVSELHGSTIGCTTVVEGIQPLAESAAISCLSQFPMAVPDCRASLVSSKLHLWLDDALTDCLLVVLQTVLLAKATP